MEVLVADVGLGNDYGSMTKNISSIYIWRTEAKFNDNDVLTYNVSHVPPADIEYETGDSLTFTGGYYSYSYPTTPIVHVRHKYSDGAELLVARAILALEEANLNV